MAGNHHHLSAIMFSDIVGYTALMGRNEAKALELLKRNREIQKPLIKKFHGVWIKEMGDGMMARFDSAYNATQCAIEIQKEAQKNFNGRLRIGLHLGEIVIENKDIFGDDVNIASRIESFADPGGIYISDPIQKSLQNHADIQTKYLGPVELKNVQELVKLHYIIGNGLATPSQKKLRHIQHAQSRKTRRRLPVLFLLLVFLAITVFSVNYWLGNRTERKVKAIAVLPFANFTGSVDEQYFVDMMHDAVIGELSKIGNIIVKSRTSTLQFRDTKLTIPEIAQILNVDAIVESSVFKTGDSIYMQVQLIQARPVEDHIWAQDYERDTRYILSLYGELAKTVAEEVEIQLSPQDETRLTHVEEVNPEAYKAYLKGQFHWNKLSKVGMDSAEYYYTISKELDPNYALAYAGLASVALVRAQNGLIPFHESAIKNIKFLEKAVELDSTESEIHFLVASFNTWGIWDYKKAETEFLEAIRLNPNNAMLRVYYSHLLCYFRNYQEAMIQGDYALRLDPFNNLTKGIYGMTLNNCREFDMADSLFNVVLQSDPYDAISLSNLKSTYHLQKKYKEAYEIWKIDSRNDKEALKVLESGYQIGGYTQALENLANLMVERSKTSFVTPWRICTLYTRAGLKDKAIEYMEKAYDVHDQNMPYIISDPIFDFLREDPRFQVIVAKMNFPS